MHIFHPMTPQFVQFQYPLSKNTGDCQVEIYYRLMWSCYNTKSITESLHSQKMAARGIQTTSMVYRLHTKIQVWTFINTQ